MESLFSFPVGLLHPLQHAGLSRRSPSCRLHGHVVLHIGDYAPIQGCNQIPIGIPKRPEVRLCNFIQSG